jgi:hypothetical protein
MEACMVPLKLLVVSLVGWGGGNLDGIVLDFTASWCGPCQQMSPVVSKLERNGFPIRKVDFDANRDLARKFNVRSIPAFVLVVDGVEQDRIVGACSEDQLKRLCARIPHPPETRPNVDEPLADANRGASVRSEAAPAPGKTIPPEERPAPPKPGFKFPSIFGDKGDKKEALPRTPPEGALSRGKSDDRQSSRPPITGDPLAASVRIRVIDAGGGIDVGSGTIIDSRVGVTTVLTCGHIFRYWDKQARIDVDYWSDGKMYTVDARRIFHNLEDDVGLICMNVDPLPSCRVASAGAKIMKGSPVISVGCSGGESPTVQNLKITALNRYLGADNIEVGGMPVQGRSGGGLFTPDGQVIGVCSGADSHHREGLYVGPKTIQALLDRCSLAHLYRPVSRGSEKQQIAEQSAGGADQFDLSTAESTQVEQLDVAQSRKGTRAPAEKAPLRKREAAPAEVAGADEGAIRQALAQAGEAEIVCIIRPINQPGAASRVVILNRASRRFVAYLSDDGDTQPNIQETTFSAKEAAPRKEAPPEKPDERQNVRRPETGNPPAAAAGSAARSDDDSPRPRGPQPYKRKPAARPVVTANGQK